MERQWSLIGRSTVKRFSIGTAIAQTLAGNLKLILADEPTAALDSQRGHTIMELLRKLAKEEGCTVLMVTHDLRIMEIADRIVYVEEHLRLPILPLCMSFN